MQPCPSKDANDLKPIMSSRCDVFSHLAQHDKPIVTSWISEQIAADDIFASPDENARGFHSQLVPDIRVYSSISFVWLCHTLECFDAMESRKHVVRFEVCE